MKLDPRAIRYLTSEDWRVLTGVEMGSKNHEVVPTPLITQIAGLRGGSGVHKSISALAKVGLIAKVKNAKYDGYRLTYGGLDYLALNTLRKNSTIFSVGNQIGVGKESDIYVVASPAGTQLVLKIHRLGRISFRTVKANRDYLRNRASGSWMYLSRLAAMKEFAFMKALKDYGFPVPQPIGQSRHTVVMELINSFPLRQIESVPDPATLYSELMDLIIRLARVGLIHGDFNEFNILIREEKQTKQAEASPAEDGDQLQQTHTEAQPEKNRENTSDIKLIPIMIDFPQMLSITHADAKFYFDRDVACIKRFFSRRFHFTSDEPGPHFSEAIKDSNLERRLDVEVEATGFNRKMAKDLEKYIETVGREQEASNDAEQADAQAFDEDDDGDQDDVDEEDFDDDPDRDLANSALDAKDSDDRNLDDGLHSKLSSMNLLSLETFVPVDLPDDNEVLNEKVQTNKKKAGWVI